MRSGTLIFLGLAVAVAAVYWFWGAPRGNDYQAEKSRGDNTTSETPPASNPAAQTSNPVGGKTYKFPGVLPATEIQNKIAIIKTPKGEIKFEILAGEGSKAASNFVYLAKEGFYNGLNFHRVEDWVIQGGDPNCAKDRQGDSCGKGGPGYRFEDEPVTLAYERGIVAMANAGPNTNGSQFFIMKRDVPLAPSYTIFGRVISGMEVADKILSGDAMAKVEITAK